jgi:succinate-acetate transporter protein
MNSTAYAQNQRGFTSRQGTLLCLLLQYSGTDADRTIWCVTFLPARQLVALSFFRLRLCFSCLFLSAAAAAARLSILLPSVIGILYLLYAVYDDAAQAVADMRPRSRIPLLPVL